MSVTIRAATAADLPEIVRFIHALADYEQLADEVRLREDVLAEQLFGSDPAASVLIAELEGRPIGFALWFRNFSTFEGRAGIYLEDLFVVPEARGQGAGKALLQALARIAVARGCARLEWAVLDWNTPAIEFYRALGARGMDGWTVNRLDGAALAALAQ